MTNVDSGRQIFGFEREEKNGSEYQGLQCEQSLSFGRPSLDADTVRDSSVSTENYWHDSDR